MRALDYFTLPFLPIPFLVLLIAFRLIKGQEASARVFCGISLAGEMPDWKRDDPNQENRD
ncbi:hypothetical protein [Salipiger mucosus]|uniref:Uncharacterized protein n=1 Tax=Salipiger mucosus DSM 16094 TaxID=1123237 RepID=S9QKV1_9RHOB|nr:hypothetical protein [Salipiger mucosus]EPX82061.1 hypothetical protein Salmuc_02428 [Salipiger mucosus DSM 16094]